MEQSKVDLFMMSNGEYFPEGKLFGIREKMLAMPDDKASMFYCLNLKKPLVALLLSLFVGHFGIDRMYVGDTGLGVLKLLTCGGLCIWTIIDWFLIMDVAKDVNFRKFTMYMQ